MKPNLSIIIPCYNSEATLVETITSVIAQEYDSWEAILVNDGSPDGLEKTALQWAKKEPRIRYYKKENGGLGSARNYGIEKAKGEFILPLDSDNKVKPLFAKEAIPILQNNEKIGVVHGNAEYFGEKKGIWNVESFNFEKMLLQNYIDACAIYRKSLWEAVGGYDTHMPYQGNEDWELWLAFANKNVSFYHLNKVTFDYRVSKNSMIKSFSSEMFKANREYVRKKYSHHYYRYFKKYYTAFKKSKAHPLLTSFNYLKIWIKSLLKKK